MEKNYSFNSFLKFKNLLILLLIVLSSNSLLSQVNITKPNLTMNACTGFPTSYNALGNIVITESNSSDFANGAGRNLVLTTPANFEFQPGIGNVSWANNGNITVTSISITATQITINYDVSGTNKSDNLTISGLMVRGITTASTGNITRTAGNGVISGLVNGTTLTNTLTTDPSCYCTPTSSNTSFYISNVTFSGINNNSVSGSGTIVYENFYSIAGNVVAGNTYPISVTATGLSPNSFGVHVYFDWNANDDFSDDGPAITLGTYTTNTTTVSGSITIPIGANIGATRMRVVNAFSSVPSPCATGGNYQFEDYRLNIAAPPACTTPTAQPTLLSLTPGGTFINGSFTAAIPASQSYLVVMNTTGVAPTSLITNGTTYTIGSSIGVGNTVVDTDSNTIFNIGGLNTNSTYYFYIYSMNNICTGGPLYNKGAIILTGNTTTTGTLPTYCTPLTVNPNNTSRYINRVAFIGTLNDINNTSTFSTATTGYQDFTGLAAKAVQAQGEGVNLIVESTGGRARLIAWIDWNKDGTFSNSEIVYGPPTAGISSTFGFVIPTGTIPGNYRIRVRTFNSFYVTGPPSTTNEYFGYNYNACETFNTGTYSGNTTTQYGEAEDYLFTVIQRCDANIVSVTDGKVCNSGPVTLGATGTSGVTGYKWYANATGGAALATTSSGSWTTPSISTTTTYYVTATNGTCESLIRKAVVANVNPTPTLTFNQAAPEICGENSIVSLSATGDKQQTNLLFENFNSGLGSFTNLNSDTNPAAVTNDTKWQKKSSAHIPDGISWKPAISSGLSPDGFAMANSDSKTIPNAIVQNALTSGTLNSTGYLNLTATLKFYFSRYLPDNDTSLDEYVRIQISTNNGTTWTTLQEFLVDVGIGTQFTNLSYDLSAYINQANLRFRILHRSWAGATGWLPDGVAVDDIRIYGDTPLSTSFNWTGGSLPDAYIDAACTLPYNSGTSVSTVYVKPTLAQLASNSFTFTANALLSNGCNVSQNITITNKTKVWKGLSGNWNDPNNWSPVGVPDINTCVVIPDVSSTMPSQITGTNYNAFGKTLQVKNGGNLQIASSNTLTIQDYVDVAASGIFHINNSASLIQVSNIGNIGNITMNRTAITDSNFDYVYWSSPVGGFNLNNVTPGSTYKYQWNPTTTTGYASNFGNWSSASGGMTTGRGYIVRGSSGTTTFSGNPNNGTISIPVTRSTYVGAPYAGPTSTLVTKDDDNWNLVGNPYPSAISADTFLSVNNSNLAQFIKIWTHGLNPNTTLATPFYQNFALNYNTADYITYNALGGTQSGFDGKIGAGQGFFVLMNDANTTTENVLFNNTMRSNAHRNDQFYRSNENAIDVERHRIWLKIIAPTGLSNDALLGYITEGTNDIDDRFDTKALGVKTNFEIYTIANDQELLIQGRALPFNNEDTVNIGYRAPADGNYTIAINEVDGLFSGSSLNIYLEDIQTGVLHDLRLTPYTFTTTAGSVNNRFLIRYSSNSLSTESFEMNNTITVYTNNNIITESNSNIKDITIYDLLGRNVFSKKEVSDTRFEITNLVKSNSPLIVKVTLENGYTKSIKIIY